jgi:hypothetical protein
MPHVTDQDSGIVADHIAAIADKVKAKNAFLFIRPTEYDSTVLIQQGYATKSVDIKTKSSNWGPMAGFVPCDPALSKKPDGALPDPNRVDHAHGAGAPVQLYMTGALVQKLVQRGKIRLYSDRGLTIHGNQLTWVQDALPSLARAPAAAAPAITGAALYVDGSATASGPRATIFLIGNHQAKLKVWWVTWTASAKGAYTGTLVPLMVWGYNGVPVTGDYDIWMAAPHITGAGMHVPTGLTIDQHGPWAASSYLKTLLGELNKVCGRTDLPVFNHGAEAQNYGFTQALDTRLVMFTPSGRSRMVDMSAMPKVLADMRDMGYVVLQNKRWGELDPHLTGKADPRITKGVKVSLRGVVHRVVTRDRFRKALQELAKAKAQPATTVVRQLQLPVVGLPHAQVRRAAAPLVTRARWNLAAAAVHHGVERARIVAFADDLRDMLSLFTQKARILDNDDFPPLQGVSTLQIAQLQHSLEQAVAQSQFGYGQSGLGLIDWALQNRTEIEHLERLAAERWPLLAS